MDLKKVLVADQVDQKVIDDLKAAGVHVDFFGEITTERLLDIIHEYDTLITRSRTQVTRKVIEAAKGLKLIARAGVGVDSIDVDAASEKGILVINAPNGNTISACELTCAHILAVSRNMFEAYRILEGGEWKRKPFMGMEVAGKTLGIIGLGRIGREVGIRMKAFQMRVIGYDPITPAEVVTPLGFEHVSLDDIWSQSDIITIHVPLMPSTKHMVNRSTLEKCKKGVMIVNVARGGIINEDHLYEALCSGRVRAAALDVFEREPPVAEDMPLIKHPNFVATPHLGASTTDAQQRVGEEIVEEIIRLNKGQKIPGAVNADKVDIHFLKTTSKTL